MKNWISWCTWRLTCRRREDEKKIPSCMREGGEEEDCLVCYETMTLSEWKTNRLLRIYPCGHIFHLRCFYLWLFQKYYFQESHPRCIKCRGLIQYFDLGQGMDNVSLKNILSRSRSLLQEEKKRCRIVVQKKGEHHHPVSFQGFHGWENELRLYLEQQWGKDSQDVKCAIAQIVASPLIFEKSTLFHHLPAYFYFSKIEE